MDDVEFNWDGDLQYQCMNEHVCLDELKEFVGAKQAKSKSEEAFQTYDLLYMKGE